MLERRRLDKVLDDVTSAGFSVTDNVLSTHDLEALRRVCIGHDQSGRLTGAGTGKTGRKDASVRGDSILWLDPDDPERGAVELFTMLDALRTAVNQQLFLNVADIECHVARYPPGAIYQRHLDRFAGGDQRRQLSFVLYLNEKWSPEDGGSLRLYLDGASEGEHLDVSPIAGRLVVFESGRYWHEVLPATRERLSVTGWFRSRS